MLRQKSQDQKSGWSCAFGTHYFSINETNEVKSNKQNNETIARVRPYIPKSKPEITQRTQTL